MEEKINVIKNRISPFVKNSKYVNFTQIDQIAFPSLEKSIDEISSPKPSYTLNSSELFEKATSRGIQKSEKKHYEIKQKITLNRKESNSNFAKDSEKLYSLIDSKFEEMEEKKENDIILNPSAIKLAYPQRKAGQIAINKTVLFISPNSNVPFSYKVEKYKPLSFNHPQVHIPAISPPKGKAK